MSSAQKKSQAGFSLTELLVVVAIILVVGGLALPSISRVVDNAKLQTSAQQLASFYQQARIRATQDNTYYEVLTSPSGVRPAQVCLDLDGDGVCEPGEPQVQLSALVSLNNTGLPVEMDATTLGFNPIKLENSVMYDQQDRMVPGLAWNGRALPCQRTSPTSACVNLIASGSVAWVQYLQMQRSAVETSYAAVSVSPTGRVKTWIYSAAPGGGRNWF